jgi:hypothetical protein
LASAGFSHKEHLSRTKECSACHTAEVGTTEFSRPKHAACKACHSKENFSSKTESGKVCRACHGENWTQIKVFPDRSRGIVALRKGGFSHEGHLDPSGKVAQRAGKISCTTCHPFDSNGRARLPKHEECALCHSDSDPSRDPDVPYLGTRSKTSDCLMCHDDARDDKTVRPAPIAAWGGQGSYSQDILFDHNQHQSHPQAQSCSGCHKGVEESRYTAAEQRHMPTMWRCEDCHGNQEVVSPSYRIDNCNGCHQTIRYQKVPEAPAHYGYSGHQAGAKREQLYCAFCHDKNPKVFAPKESYNDACKSCHAAEEVKPGLLSEGPRLSVGKSLSKSGFSARAASSIELRNGRAFDPTTDAVDQNDIDLYQDLSLDLRGYGLPNVNASVMGRFLVDPGFTPAFSQFEGPSTLDQQPPADRGSVLSNGPIDRRQNAALYLYRGFAEIKNQPLPGPLSELRFDARLGRQMAYDTATPVFFDGGTAKVSLGRYVALKALAGQHVNFFNVDPLGAPLIVGAGLKVTPTSTVEANFDAVKYLATTLRADLKGRLTPYTWGSASLRFDVDGQFANSLSYADAAIDYYNPRSKTGLLLAYTFHNDSGVFDFDYSSVTTQGGTIAPDGRQQQDFEGVNLFTLPDFQRFQATLRQDLGPRTTASLLFTRRKLLETRTAVQDAGFDQLADQDALAQLGDVLAAVALDNRLAYAMSYFELSPGVDFTDLFVPGLKLGTRLRFRGFQPLGAIPIGEGGAFFTDVSGEGEKNQLVFDLEASQKLLNGKVRLGAFFEAQRFDYAGRFVELKGLDIFSTAADLSAQIAKSLWLKTQYSFSSDLVLFDADDTVAEFGSPNSPILGDGDIAEVNTHDVLFVQRLFFSLMWRY